MLSLLALGSLPSYAGSAEGQLRVSAQAVASLSFEVLKEPRYFKVERKRHQRDSRSSKDKDDDESKDHHSSKHGKHDSIIKKHIIVFVKTNSRDGYALLIQAVESSVYRYASIDIEGHGNVSLREGQSLEVPIRRRSINGKSDLTRLKVRLSISHDARQGKYPWPISVSAIPL